MGAPICRGDVGKIVFSSFLTTERILPCNVRVLSSGPFENLKFKRIE